MKGMLKGVAALALATALFTSTAQAQGAQFGLAGSGLFSLEEGGGTGFGGTLLVGFQGGEGSPIGFRVDGTYITDFFDSGEGAALFTANVIYTFRTSEGSKFHPYLIGTGGYAMDVGSDIIDVSDFLAGAGAGFNIMMENSNITPFVEGRFLNFFFEGESASSIQALAGIKISR